MNFDENITDVFDRFLNGEMNEAEKKEFLQQLETDPALKEAYEWHRTMVAGIREARREELKDYIKKNSNIRYIGNIWGRNWVMTSAAIITLFFGAYIAIEYFIKPATTNENVAANQKISDSIQTDTALPMEGLAEAHPVEEPVQEKDEVKKDGVVHQNKNEDVVAQTPTTQEAPEKALDNTGYTVNYFVLEKDREDREYAPKVSSNNAYRRYLNVVYEEGSEYSYKYDKTTLVLYRVPKEDAKSVYEYNNATYLAWNKTYYPLKADGKANKLETLKDSAVIKNLPVLK